ncbi:hypothetical protein FI667_g564, partial [Globisporangium splendens]
MKSTRLAALVVIGLTSSLEASFGAECTTKEITEIETITQQMAGNPKCSAYSSMNSANTATDELCKDNTCLSLVKEVVSKYPDCTLQGVNMKDMLQLGLAVCDSSSSPKVVTTAPAPTSGVFSVTSASIPVLAVSWLLATSWALVCATRLVFCHCRMLAHCSVYPDLTTSSATLHCVFKSKLAMELSHIATFLAIGLSSSLDSGLVPKEQAQVQMANKQLSGSTVRNAFRGAANPVNAFDKALCSGAKCLTAIKDANPQYPNCTFQEINTKVVLQFGINWQYHYDEPNACNEFLMERDSRGFSVAECGVDHTCTSCNLWRELDGRGVGSSLCDIVDYSYDLCLGTEEYGLKRSAHILIARSKSIAAGFGETISKSISHQENVMY